MSQRQMPERGENITPAIEALKGRADALHVVSDPLLLANGIRINTLALGARLPTIYGYREGVEVGGLMSYGPSISHLWRRAAELVDKISYAGRSRVISLSSSRPSSICINLKTAKALGLEIPDKLLAIADEVIE